MTLDAYIGARYAGYCNLNREDNDELFIADIKVNADKREYVGGWRKLLGIKGKLIVSRREGVGNTLMAKVLSIAKKEGATKIYGYVGQNDLDEFSGLLEWYRRLGYEISEPDGKQIVPAEKMITMVF